MIVPGKRLQDYQSSWKENATVTKTDLKTVKVKVTHRLECRLPLPCLRCTAKNISQRSSLLFWIKLSTWSKQQSTASSEPSSHCPLLRLLPLHTWKSWTIGHCLGFNNNIIAIFTTIIIIILVLTKTIIIITPKNIVIIILPNIFIITVVLIIASQSSPLPSRYSLHFHRGTRACPVCN